MATRTCIGCREVCDRTELLRVVVCESSAQLPPGANAYRVVPDVAARLPGRGAWLHNSQSCLDMAVRKRAFGRAFRRGGQPDVSAVSLIISTDRPTAKAGT